MTINSCWSGQQFFIKRRTIIKKRILNIFIAIDQLLWVLITLGNGCPDETISSAMWRFEQSGKIIGKIGRPIVDLLFFWDKNHCYNSFLAEINNTQLPKYYR